jgi:hypothetical protein
LSHATFSNVRQFRRKCFVLWRKLCTFAYWYGFNLLFDSCLLALAKIQTNYYRTNFFLQIFTFYREALSSFWWQGGFSEHSREVRRCHQNETFSSACSALIGNFSSCKHSNCDSQQERNGLCRWELGLWPVKFLTIVIRQRKRWNLYFISYFNICT